MSLLTTAVLDVGTAAAKYILKRWLGDSSLEYDIGSSLMDVLKSQTPDVIAQRKGQRQFEDIGDQIGESLIPFFQHTSSLDDGDRIAIAYAIKEAFDRAALTSELLVKRNLDPTILAQYVLNANPAAMQHFSEASTELYRLIIKLTCSYIVNIASQLPSFTENSFAEVLKREDQIINIAQRMLEELRKMRKDLDPMLEADQFEIEYRTALARNLDVLHLIGADVSLPNRRHRLTIAYIPLFVEQKRTLRLTADRSTAVDANRESQNFKLDSAEVLYKSVNEGGIRETAPFHKVLATSKRILIRGLAGSGKTTLLQWIAVRAATKTFEEELTKLNNHIPFYIRLRSCIQKGLPSHEKFPSLAAPLIADTMPKGWTHGKLKTGNALILIDGIDEVPEYYREEVHSWLIDLVETYPLAYFLVTSRPHAIKQGWMNHQDFHRVEIQPMGLLDIYTFIDHWHRAVREELQLDEEKNELRLLADHLKWQINYQPTLRRLARTPLLCAILCALNRERKQQLPLNRIELYKACCELLLERREKESHIDLSDYPPLRLDQKERILQDLAYWMIQNDLAEAEITQVDKHFKEQVSYMSGLAQETSGTAVRCLLVERSGILREPVVGYIDFTHRTFEEFFAAKAIISESNIKILVEKAHLDQWREVIILSAGLATKAHSEQLITGIIERGDKEKESRQLLHLLTVSCLETVIELRPEIRAEVEKRLKRLLPPKDIIEAQAVAAAGELVVKHLKKRTEASIAINIACIRALTFIGSDLALLILETYPNDERKAVKEELLKAWNFFDWSAFAQRIFSQLSISSVKLERITTLEGLQFATHLNKLDLSKCNQISDLSPLADLTNLTYLDLAECNQISDLSPLNNLANLFILNLSKCNQVTDLSPLAGLTNLTSLNMYKCNQISDLSPLASLTNLTYLDLAECNQISDLSPLANLTNLSILNLSKCNQISDLSPLAGLIKLKLITIGLNGQNDWYFSPHQLGCFGP